MSLLKWFCRTLGTLVVNTLLFACLLVFLLVIFVLGFEQGQKEARRPPKAPEEPTVLRDNEVVRPGGRWDDPATWSRNRVPDRHDRAIVPGGITITVGAQPDDSAESTTEESPR